jgi:hypothetical protein
VLAIKCKKIKRYACKKESNVWPSLVGRPGLF